MIEEMALELEVDDEVHMSPFHRRREGPSVCQMLERASFSCAHQHLARSIQRDLACKALPECAEPDLEAGDDFLRALAVNSRAAAPGHERGIVLYVGHDREKLVGRVGKRLLFLVTWHVPSSCLQTVLSAQQHLAVVTPSSAGARKPSSWRSWPWVRARAVSVAAACPDE